MHDIVSILYVAVRKLYVVIDSKVKNCSFMLFYKNCHQPRLCIPRHVGIILSIFEKFQYYFDFDKLAITLQPSGNGELCHFEIHIEKKIAYFSFFGGKNLKAVESLFMFFPYQKLIRYFSI